MCFCGSHPIIYFPCLNLILPSNGFLWHSFRNIFLNIYLCIWKWELQREGEAEWERFIYLFTPQVAKSLIPGLPNKCKDPGIFYCFPRNINRTSSGAELQGTWTGAQKYANITVSGLTCKPMTSALTSILKIFKVVFIEW